MDQSTDTVNPRAMVLMWLTTRAPHFIGDSTDMVLKCHELDQLGCPTANNLGVRLNVQQLVRLEISVGTGTTPHH